MTCRTRRCSSAGSTTPPGHPGGPGQPLGRPASPRQPTRISAAPCPASSSTSAAGTSTTRMATPSSSTGGRRCPGRSTGPARPSRWAWRMRRRFGFSGGELTAYEDEDFTRADAAAGGGRGRAGQPDPDRRDRAAEVRPDARHRATIQPEQDDIVRADADRTVCVQGAPGTGKTAVGLHRVAYLLYAHRERMSRGGVLVVGPNRAFLSYIGKVLPALGELDVTQVSVDRPARPRCRSGPPTRSEAARIKGDARMAGGAAPGALGAARASPPEALVLVRGSRRWRVPAHDARRRWPTNCGSAGSATGPAARCSRTGSPTWC